MCFTSKKCEIQFSLFASNSMDLVAFLHFLLLITLVYGYLAYQDKTYLTVLNSTCHIWFELILSRLAAVDIWSCDIEYTLTERRSPTEKQKHLAIPESDSKVQTVEILCHERSNKISEIEKASESVSHQGKNPQEHIPAYQFPTSSSPF